MLKSIFTTLALLSIFFFALNDHSAIAQSGKGSAKKAAASVAGQCPVGTCALNGGRQAKNLAYCSKQNCKKQ